MAYKRSTKLAKQIVREASRMMRLGYSECECFRDSNGMVQGFAHKEKGEVYFKTFHSRFNVQVLNVSLNGAHDLASRRVCVTLARNYRLNGVAAL